MPQTLADLILARLDALATSDDPADWADAAQRMHHAIRVVVTGSDADITNPEWVRNTIARELDIDLTAAGRS